MSTSVKTENKSSSSLVLEGRQWVTPLAWSAVLLDGFDAVVLGASMPKLMEDPELGLTGTSSTFIATVGLVGMMIGALAMGWLTDKFGRRRLLIGAVLAFSILTVAIGFVHDPISMAVLRFLAGVGLGGCLPTAISMVTEFSPRGRSSNATTVLMTGYHIGAVLTALLAIFVAAYTADGWRWMFWAAGIPAVLLLPLMWKYLPESPEYLLQTGRSQDARIVADHYGIVLEEDLPRPYGEASPEEAETEKQGAALLLQPKYRRNTVLVWIASFMGLLLVYGLNTWLPTIMIAADYGLNNSLGFLLVLNAGAVVGLLIAGRVGDKITPRNAAIIWFLSSAVLLALLVVRLPPVGVYIMLFATGCMVFSSQNLIYAFTATNYPAKVRGTALGMSAGVGRLGAISGPILGGAMLGAGIAYPWGFFAFALVGLFGGISAVGLKTMNYETSDSAPAEKTTA